MNINKTELQIEKKKGKYGIEYSPASASDGPLIAGGPTLNMEFPHLKIFLFNLWSYVSNLLHSEH